MAVTDLTTGESTYETIQDGESIEKVFYDELVISAREVEKSQSNPA